MVMGLAGWWLGGFLVAFGFQPVHLNHTLHTAWLKPSGNANLCSCVLNSPFHLFLCPAPIFFSLSHIDCLD